MNINASLGSRLFAIQDGRKEEIIHQTFVLVFISLTCQEKSFQVTFRLKLLKWISRVLGLLKRSPEFRFTN